MHLMAGHKVYAFEPFSGNHRFFDPNETGIHLFPSALSETNGAATLLVPSVVSEDSVWGKRGLVGYSSLGHVVPGPPTSSNDVRVQCVRGDDVIPPGKRVGFIKLDLQGGELSALRGMTRVLKEAKLVWIEFTGQAGLLDFLIDAGFMVFDTEYFLTGSPALPATESFEVSKQDIVLSTGTLAWFGFRKKAWKNFEAEFIAASAQLKMVQTDLVCINRKHLDEFIAALPFLSREGSRG